jgi:hypothetical protein
MLPSCCAVSRVIKGLKLLSINSSTGATLASKGKLYIHDFQGLAVLSLPDPLAALKKVLGVVLPKIPTNAQVPSNTPTRTRVQRFVSKQVSSNVSAKTSFQRFVSNPPHLSFKKLILSSLQGVVHASAGQKVTLLTSS